MDGETLGGHKDSIPVGPIIEVYETDDSIIGRGVIWAEEFPEVSKYLKKRTAESNPPGTSWEILYEGSYTEGDIEYLTGTYYAANTIVANPSYGDRTLLRAIAEDLGVEMDDTENPIIENPTEELQKEEANLDEERNEILELQNMLYSMFGMLDDMWCKTFEIEEAEMTKTENVEGFSARIQDLVTRLSTRANEAGVAMAETKNQLETLQTELDTLKAEKAQAETEAKTAKRKADLAEAGVEVDTIETLLTLDDTAFSLFVSTLKQVKGKSVAEITRIELPDPLTTSEVTTDVLVESHKEVMKKGNRK